MKNEIMNHIHSVNLEKIGLILAHKHMIKVCYNCKT